MADQMFRNRFRVGYRQQTVWGTPAAEGAVANWSWIKCTWVTDTPARDIEDLNVGIGQTGTDDRPSVGAKKGNVTFSYRLTSMAAGYVATPALTTILTLIEDWLGASTVGGAVNVEELKDDGGTDANTWEFKAASALLAEIGVAFFFGNSVDGIQGLGWIESQAGGAGTDATLIMDTRAVPDDTNDDNDNLTDLWEMATLYPDDTHPTPFTLRVVGHNIDHDVRYIDCIIESMKITLDAAKQMIVEISARYYDQHYAAAGTFVAGNAPPDDLEIPTLTGPNNSRAIIVEATQIAGYDDGTADPQGVCGIEDLEVEITADLEERPCHGARHVGKVYVSAYHCTVNATFPFDQADMTAMSTEQAEADYNALRTMIEKSLGSGALCRFLFEVGDTAGQMFSILIPSMRINAAYSHGESGNKAMTSASFQAAPYANDGAATAGGNKAFRLAFG